MKCEKCGMVCKDTQKFCLNCGNPLHPEEPEDIQEQLANSVGELLDGFDDDDDDDEDDFRVELDESMFEDEAVKVQKELQVENIYSRERAEEESEWEYDEDKYFGVSFSKAKLKSYNKGCQKWLKVLKEDYYDAYSNITVPKGTVLYQDYPIKLSNVYKY